MSVVPIHNPRLADVDITEELYTRTRRVANLQAEAIALIELSRLMAVAPDEAIHKSLEFARQLCNAGSAGLSLLQDDPSHGRVFRWSDIDGELLPHVGEFSLRNASPCAIAIDSERTVLVAHPYKAFQYFRDATVPVIECLVVPIFDTGRLALGTIWLTHHTNDRHFDAEDARIVEQLAVQLVLALKLQDEKETVRKRLEEAETASTLLRLQNETLAETVKSAKIESEQIAAKDALHRAILDSSVDYAILSTNRDGIITSWNEGAKHVLGWSEEEITGRSAEVIFTPDDVKNNIPRREMIRSLESGRASDERWHQRKDGSCFWASGLMMPLRTETNEHIGFLKILRDRTDQRQIQDALRNSEARTRLALEAVNIGIWEINFALGQIDGDARARELFGTTSDETLDYDSFLKCLHEDDCKVIQEQLFEVLSSAREVFDAQCRTISKQDGLTRSIHIMGRVIETEAGRRFMGTVRDITEQKQAEERQALLIGEFQHRINNTLTIVQAIVNQSLRNADTPLSASKTISERLISLGNAHNLLTKTNWQAALIIDIVNNAIKIHSATMERIRLRGPNILLGARPALNLSLVLHELCTNAVKYGALSVDAGYVDIEWDITGKNDDQQFYFVWQECCGAPVILPQRKGFGSRLIENSFSGITSAKTVYEFKSEGVCWRLDIPLTAISG